MEGNKYFDELKRAFGFECYVEDLWNLRGKDINYASYISESAEGDTLYILKDAGGDIQIMTDVFTGMYTLIDAIRDILMDGDKICVDDNLGMWLDMETGEFWEKFYDWCVDKKYIKTELE